MTGKPKTVKLLKRLLSLFKKRPAKPEQVRPSFKLRDGSVHGNGLTPEFKDASWEMIREAIYEGRGG